MGSNIKLIRWSVFSLALFLLLIFPPRLFPGSEPISRLKVVHTSPKQAEKLNQLDQVTVTITFNQDIDPTIQEDAVLVQRGAIDSDGNPVEIKGEISWPDPKTFKFVAKDSLMPNATYQMSLYSVRNAKGEEWDEVPFRLLFTTGPDKKNIGIKDLKN
jgi:hypothetical protein